MNPMSSPVNFTQSEIDYIKKKQPWIKEQLKFDCTFVCFNADKTELKSLISSIWKKSRRAVDTNLKDKPERMRKELQERHRMTSIIATMKGLDLYDGDKPFTFRQLFYLAAI